MTHMRFQTVRTYLVCGKCKNKWYITGYYVKAKCTKCNHEDITSNSI